MSDEQLHTELADTIAEVPWAWLVPHSHRDAIVIVDDQLDLLDVGLAIAGDRSAQVQEWIQSAQLLKPSLEQLERWERYQPQFKAMIVQPFVIIQAIAPTEEAQSFPD